MTSLKGASFVLIRYRYKKITGDQLPRRFFQCDVNLLLSARILRLSKKTVDQNVLLHDCYRYKCHNLDCRLSILKFLRMASGGRRWRREGKYRTLCGSDDKKILNAF